VSHPDVGQVNPPATVQRCKGDHPPGRVKQNRCQTESGRCHEEVLGLSSEADGAGPVGIGQDVDQRKCAGHHAEPETDNISQNVFVGEDLSLFVLGKLLEVGVGFSKQQVDEQSKQFLEKDGEDEAEGQLVSKGHDREPEHRGQEQREEPEESAKYQDDNLHWVLGDGQGEQGQGRSVSR